jgi:NAD(P)-dependent dehydrogenase (short-subunit alcohol dehydrogenase family)
MERRLQGLHLQGKRALITGGVRRLGRAFALALAAEGADVVVTTRVLDAAAKESVQELCALGVRAHVVLCDVMRPEQVMSAVSDAVGLLGGLDLLVNSAGAFETASLDSLEIERWDAMFAVNVRGPFLVAQVALPHLRASGGRIINIGSLGGLKPWVSHGHYCASKAALHSLSQTMAKAWAPQVSVNCIAPGMITFPGEAPRMADKTPMQRDGSAADVVAAVLFFATAPEFITGQILAVDGGLSLA